MASEKVARILRSKSPMSEDQISAMTDQAAWDWVYSNRVAPRAKRTEVCFTGFLDEEKEALAAKASEAGLKVVTTVTKKLDLLCTGDNPGAVKLEKAHKQGTRVLTPAEFQDYLAALDGGT
jgi:NAD-dependent DNA ligase